MSKRTNLKSIEIFVFHSCNPIKLYNDKFRNCERKRRSGSYFPMNRSGEEGDKTPSIEINGVIKRQKSRVEVKVPIVFI